MTLRGGAYLDGQGPFSQIHLGVVLGVTETLDVVEGDWVITDRERTPVPGSAVKDETIEGPKKKSRDGVEVSGVAEGDIGGGHDDHRRYVEDEERLGVGVVAVEAVAEQSVLGPGDLLGRVGDHVQMDIVPFEGQTVAAVGGVGIGYGQPTEGRPGVGCERLGVDCPGDVGLGPDLP